MKGRQFYLGVDGKTCIWPMTKDCLWTPERYLPGRVLKLDTSEEFVKEAGIFVEILKNYDMYAEITCDIPDVILRKCCEPELDEEGYILEVGAAGVKLKANTCCGIFYSFMTLLQLLTNSPDGSISGVTIKDKPFKKFRGIHIQLPSNYSLCTFRRFIDFLCKYKLNKLILEFDTSVCIGTGAEEEGLEATVDYEKGEFKRLMAYARERHLEVIPLIKLVPGSERFLYIGELIGLAEPRTVKLYGYGSEKGPEGCCGSWGFESVICVHENELESMPDRIRRENITGVCLSVPYAAQCLEDQIYGVLKLTASLWWGDPSNCSSHLEQHAVESLERTILHLYPSERDRILDIQPPSSLSKSYRMIGLRKFYNTPLYRLYWVKDDYDFMHLKDAVSLPGTVPFSLFQGVLDYRTDYSMVLSGNGWNNGVYDIPVDVELQSLVFLHSFIAAEDVPKNEIVGYYTVHYIDSSKEIINIVNRLTITHHKGRNKAPDANPVFSGITNYGAPYTIYSQEWINPRPDIKVEKVDVIPCDSCGDGGIALFGITAVTKDGRGEL